MLVNEGKKENLESDINANAANFRVGLFVGAPTIAPGLAFGGLTEANYSGYARQTPAYGAVGIVADQAIATAGNLTFAHNGGGVANTVTGWFLLNTTTNKLRGAALLAAPRSMGASGDSIVLTPGLLEDELP